jgi:uncharacterized protein (TIGR00730 family)
MEAEQSTLPVLRSICVFCGSRPGAAPQHLDAAAQLGAAIARAGIRLVYGGGDQGLMGAVARAALGGGGRVTGVIPKFLMERERALTTLDDLIVTDDLYERKRVMLQRSDAFVALPGGIGTLEELLVQLSWAQLGLHAKPIILLNVDHFWDALIDLLAHMRAQGFILPTLDVHLLVEEDVLAVVPRLLRLSQSPREASCEDGVISKF